MTSLFDRKNWVREIHLIGLGGIGSWVAFYLLKLDVPEIHVYDDDAVEEHNTYCQLYSMGDVGKLKVQALIDYAEREGYSTKIVAHTTRVSALSELALSGVVICAVDSMASRIEIWELLRFNRKVELYMDGRIGGDNFHRYTLNPSNPSQIDAYESWLYPDAEVRRAPCSERDDFESGVVLAGLIIKSLTSFARGKRSAEILQGNLSVVTPLGGATPVVQIP